MNLRASLESWANGIRRQTLTVYFAARDPRTPLAVRVLGLLVAAYALSPIDLIPDFIPVIGYLDDLLIVPLGLALVVRLTPAEVIESSRERVRQATASPVSYASGVAIGVLWLLLAALLAYALFR